MQGILYTFTTLTLII